MTWSLRNTSLRKGWCERCDIAGGGRSSLWKISQRMCIKERELTPFRAGGGFDSGSNIITSEDTDRQRPGAHPLALTVNRMLETFAKAGSQEWKYGEQTSKDC